MDTFNNYRHDYGQCLCIRYHSILFVPVGQPRMHQNVSRSRNKIVEPQILQKKWNKETWFFGESLSLQLCFDIYWPLVDVSIYSLNHVIVRPTKILIGKTILNNRLPFSTGQNFTSIQPCAPVWNEIAKRHGKMSSFRIDRTYSLGAAIRKNGARFTSIFDRTVSQGGASL